MMTMMGHGYDEDPYLFHIRFKSPVRPDWRCRGCVVIIIITTVGDAEDCTMMVIIDDDNGDGDDDGRRSFNHTVGG